MTLRAVLVLILASPFAFGAPIDLNAASADELEALPGIGPSTAQRIVRVRDRNGPYRCIEELRAVPRLTEAQLATLRKTAKVEGEDPRCKTSEATRRAGKPLIAEPRR